MTDWELIEDLLIKENKPVWVKARGTSMYPSIFTGDELLLTPAENVEIVRDQEVVLSKTPSGQYYVHRYFKKEQLTKGDNNFSFDHDEFEIIGRLTEVKKTPISFLKRIYYYVLKRVKLLQKTDK